MLEYLDSENPAIELGNVFVSAARERLPKVRAALKNGRADAISDNKQVEREALLFAPTLLKRSQDAHDGALVYILQRIHQERAYAFPDMNEEIYSSLAEYIAAAMGADDEMSRSEASDLAFIVEVGIPMLMKAGMTIEQIVKMPNNIAKLRAAVPVWRQEVRKVEIARQEAERQAAKAQKRPSQENIEAAERAADLAERLEGEAVERVKAVAEMVIDPDVTSREFRTLRWGQPPQEEEVPSLEISMELRPFGARFVIECHNNIAAAMIAQVLEKYGRIKMEG